MQDAAVVLGGFEPVYLQKLALYLDGRGGGRFRVGIAGSPTEGPDGNPVWIGSEEFLASVREHREDARCILLAEEPGDESAVYRYQPCEKLYQQIILRYRLLCGSPEEGIRTGRQHWTVLTTDGTMAELMAFSLTCAQVLGERGRVLYLNLSECSGMAEMFVPEPGTDLSDLAEALRGDEPVCLEAYVRQLERADCILPPSNPMILHELRESDTLRLIKTVEEREEYGEVVAALGTTCCGCDHILKAAGRVFHLMGREPVGAYSRREWTRFIDQCRDGDESPPERIRLPGVPAEGSGPNLLRAWTEGALGQLARRCLGCGED